MFEHLDDPNQRARDLEAEYGAVAVLSAQMRRRRAVVVTSIALSLVATGGVSGLVLGAPGTATARFGVGALLALGGPRSTNADLPAGSLTSSERTSANTCPSLADAGRPTSSAAVAVAVTDAVVVDPAAATGGGAAGVPGTEPSISLGGGPSSFSLGSAGGSASTGHATSGASHGTPHPVPGTPPTTHPPSTTPPGGGSGGGGGVTVPPIIDPTTPPVIDPSPDPSGDPSGDPAGGAGDPSGGTETPGPTDTGDPGPLGQVLTP